METHKWIYKFTPFLAVASFMLAIMAISEFFINEKVLTSYNEIKRQAGPFSEIFIQNINVELTCNVCEGHSYLNEFNRLCIHNQSNGTSTFFTIPWSNVTYIVIEHIIVSTWEEKFADVDICSSEDGSCSYCGSAYFLHLEFAEMVTYDRSDWFRHVICDNNGVQGNQVKLTVFNEAATLCEIQIFGHVLMENAVRKLQVSFPRGQSVNAETQGLFQTYDGSFASEVEECFVSAEATNAEATFIIPHSYVTHVNILTTFDKSAAIEGTIVFICKVGLVEKCSPCGVIRDTDRGSWVTVHCTTGMIEGNEVKLKHYYGRLQMCEIQVYGKELDRGLGTLSEAEVELVWGSSTANNQSHCGEGKVSFYLLERTNIQRVQLTANEPYPENCVEALIVYLCPNETPVHDETVEIVCHSCGSRQIHVGALRMTFYCDFYETTAIVIRNYATYLTVEAYGELLDARDENPFEQRYQFLQSLREWEEGVVNGDWATYDDYDYDYDYDYEYK